MCTRLFFYSLYTQMADLDSLDSLTSTKPTKSGPDDLIPLLGKTLGSIRYKFFVFLFFLFLLISSDVFVSRLLSRFDHATSMGCPTSYGKLLQGGALIIGGIALDALISNDVI